MLSEDQRAEKIANLERLANEYVDRAQAAWWPGAKKSHLRIATAAWLEIEKLKKES